MSLEAWGDESPDTPISEARVEEAFRDGLRVAREYMARFVEQGGDSATAASIRANWNPAWGADEGQLSGELWIDPWCMTQEMRERGRQRCERAMAEAEAEPAQAGTRPQGQDSEAGLGRSPSDAVGGNADAPEPSRHTSKGI